MQFILRLDSETYYLHTIIAYFVFVATVVAVFHGLDTNNPSNCLGNDSRGPRFTIRIVVVKHKNETLHWYSKLTSGINIASTTTLPTANAKKTRKYERSPITAGNKSNLLLVLVVGSPWFRHAHGAKRTIKSASSTISRAVALFKSYFRPWTVVWPRLSRRICFRAGFCMLFVFLTYWPAWDPCLKYTNFGDAIWPKQ